MKLCVKSVRVCVCVRARAQCKSLGIRDKIYIRGRVSTLKFIWPENSNCDFAERKILILQSVLHGLTPKSDSTDTVNTSTPFLNTPFSRPYYLIPRWAKYLCQQPQRMFLPQSVRPSFTPIQTNRQHYSPVYLIYKFLNSKMDDR
jgi:hypothetical protein